MVSKGTPLQVGVIGLGNIGHWHASLTRDLDAEVVVGLDVSPEARAGFEDEFDCPTTDDMDSLLTHDVDAVIITTPNRFHEEYAVTALDAGVNVLCEKPLAHSLESAERIVATAEESDARLMVGFNNRFRGPAEEVKKEIAAGTLGDVVHVEANFIRRRGVPGRGTWFTREDLSGGGALIDLGVHAIDLALYLLGYPEVTEVSGVTRSQFGGSPDYTYVDMHGEDHGHEQFDVDDSVTALIRCADGQTITLDVAWATNRDDTEEFVVRGTDAGAAFELNGDEVTYYTVNRGDETDPLPTPTVETGDFSGHQAEQAYFFDCIREGRPLERNCPEEGLVVQQVIEAIYRSSESGRAAQVRGTAARGMDTEIVE